MKTLVMHHSPHLDEVVCAWMFRKFHLKFKDVRFAFVDAGHDTIDGKPADHDVDVVHIGVGGGRFDEHTSSKRQSAATLVHEWLTEQAAIPKGDFTEQALELLVSYTLRDDTGELLSDQSFPYHVSALFSGLRMSEKSDEHLVHVGSHFLDAFFAVLMDWVRVGHEWDRRREFETPWGRGVGIETSAATVQQYAYGLGFVLTVQFNPQDGYRSIHAHPESSVNLEQTYQEILQKEPNADWYLHQSKKILLCGGKLAKKARLSKLTLDELIQVVCAKSSE